MDIASNFEAGSQKSEEIIEESIENMLQALAVRNRVNSCVGMNETTDVCLGLEARLTAGYADAIVPADMSSSFRAFEISVRSRNPTGRKQTCSQTFFSTAQFP